MLKSSNLKRLVLALWLLVPPGVSMAQSGVLEQAFEAYDASDYAQAIALSEKVLASDASGEARLDARVILGLAQFERGRSGRSFLDELRQLDRELARVYGVDSVVRIDVLSMISALEYELGGGENRLTDIQIVRIARTDPDLEDDLLFALRNIAVDYSNEGDSQVAVLFAALYDYHSGALRDYSDPITMEAAAMLSSELIWAGETVRGLEKFAAYSMDDWAAFAEIGPDEADITDQMVDAVNEALEDQSVDWMAELNARSEVSAALDAKVDEIDKLIGAGDIDAAFAIMDDYLLTAAPDDVVVGTFLTTLTKHYMSIGQFSKARPYLGGLLAYPAVYAAALDMPVAMVAATAAGEGGVDDGLLEAFLLKAIEVEEVLQQPDPELLIDLTFRLGEMKARTGDSEAAFVAFEKTVNRIESTGYEDAPLYNRALYGAGSVLVAQGRLDEAVGYLERFLDAARKSGDTDGVSTALGELALAEVRRNRPDAAIGYSRQKLALEKNRVAAQPDAIATAQINLAAVMFSRDAKITPDLAELLREMFSGEIENPDLRAARTELFRLISASLGKTPDELRSDALFAELRPQAKAEIVAGLADMALDIEDMDRAKSFLTLGFEAAAERSAEYFDLKLAEGRVALWDNRPADALAAFRQVTDHRLPAGVRPSPGALAHLPYHLSAAFELAVDPETGRDLRFQNEMFQVAQIASATVAGGALNDAIARSQTDGDLGDLLRERQALARELEVLDKAVARARYDGKAPNDLLARADATRKRQAELGARISAIAPTFASIAGLDPIPMEQVVERLRADELLAVFVSSDLTVAGDAPGSFVIAVAHDRVLVSTLPSRTTLTDLSRRLHCSAALTDPNCRASGAGGTRGSFNPGPSSEPAGPAFDTGLAHEAYKLMFEPLEEIMQGKKRLVVVADQALVSLPFHLLLQDPLDPSRPLREGNWLIRDHSVEVMPSISSFVALRDDGAQTTGKLRFLGIGDPLIGTQRDGPLPFECGDTEVPVLTAALDASVLNRGLGAVRTRAVGDLAALPDTRCELRRIARHFGDDSKVLLHDQASETEIKRLSEEGALREYAVISFATHGLVAGEIGVNDSGLVLSPPDLPTARDDGLLTTEEIAALDLDADFVILSACNTASGDSRNQEGLSGMASAFFFAGTRSLMVSHWPVYSDAAVELTTRSFTSLQADADMSRAEALRLAMLSILDDPYAAPRQTHPSYWGPFMIIGDGLGF